MRATVVYYLTVRAPCCHRCQTCVAAVDDIPLLVSRNGWNFTYLGDRQPIARPTLDSDVGNSRLWLTKPMTIGDKEYYYVTRGNMNEDGEVANSTDGSPKTYRSEVAVGITRVDGLFSLDSPYGRTVNATTNPLIYSPRSAITKLLLNVDASAGGAVRVELQTSSGETLLGPSEPITHSSIRAQVNWPPRPGFQASNVVLAHAAGKPVVLHFVMEEAKLYTFQFA